MVSPSVLNASYEHAECVVTPELLRKAKGRKDVCVKDYNSTTCEIDPSKANVVVTPAKELLAGRKKIYDSALELVGGTPLVRLDRLAKFYGLECDLLGKCEFMSIGGSVKDRIAKCMIERAERDGKLKPGSLIVEATSGNAGVGLCLTSAVKGYKTIIAMPEKMSREKLNTMKALGAEILRTPTEAAWNDPSSHITLAEQLAATIPDCHFLDQYSNEANPLAHYLGTAEEIIYQCDGSIDMFVATAGTGGTSSGACKKIKEAIPTCVTVGVDPEGSILAQPAEMNQKNLGVGYQIEGIGYDFIPTTCAREYVDVWTKTNDYNAFVVARECIRREGLLVGGSCGSALAGAIQMAKGLKKGQKCVVILPDGARNYMSKFYADEWMEDFGFMVPHGYDESAFKGKTVADLGQPSMAAEAVVELDSSLEEALKMMKEKNRDIAVVTAGGKVVGLVSRAAITQSMLTGRFTLADSKVQEIVNRAVRTASSSTTLAEIARTLRLHDAVVEVDPSTGAPQRVVRIGDVADSLC